MNYAIRCFVLFSAIVIVACVIVLILPVKETNAMGSIMANENAIEGFQTANLANLANNAAPSAASQPNLSHMAGSADGSSDHQHLLDNLLKKHDRLAEAFETRDANAIATPVSATTTKKNSIASTGADADAITSQHA